MTTHYIRKPDYFSLNCLARSKCSIFLLGWRFYPTHKQTMTSLCDSQGNHEGNLNFFQTQPELSELRQKHTQARQDGVAENVATVLLRYEGPGTDDQILKALDNKYDALKDKLLLEALKKQLGMYGGDQQWTFFIMTSGLGYVGLQ